MYDNVDDTLNLLGELSANVNDVYHEIFHISSVYNIMNSDIKNFSDFYSKVPSKKKREYVIEQKNFLEKTDNKGLKIKKEENIDFGDAMEIETFGFCISEFYLLSVLNLFRIDNWYNEENYKIFKDNFIKWCKNNEDKTKNCDESINIKSYIDKSKILQIFFDIFKLDDDETINKNILLLKRKKEFNDETNENLIFSRELCMSYHTYPRPDNYK